MNDEMSESLEAIASLRQKIAAESERMLLQFLANSKLCPLCGSSLADNHPEIRIGWLARVSLRIEKGIDRLFGGKVSR
jgi:DNA repair exonuclease SbcCD ATPase subunit